MDKQYGIWMEKAFEDADVVEELKDMVSYPEKIEDAFYRSLEFGTGGLRGVIGAGTNRVNIYTIRHASQGVANYVLKHFCKEERKIAISYDSRIKSDLFAKEAAGVFAANGIMVYIYDELMPTPCLSFAVRELMCAAGIMITASHNPAKYNGYKVYGSDGCQITTETAADILNEIERIDLFNEVKCIEFEKGVQAGSISFIGETIITKYIEAVKEQTMLNKSSNIDKNLKIIYSPLNGTGLKPIIRTLRESGYTNITLVKEQEQPDGNFPTCSYPNPEMKEAMSLGISYIKKQDADLFIATDPDCDRVGVSVKIGNEYVLLTGNEIGILLFDYICARRTESGTMPRDPVVIKTIVTTDMVEAIAAKYDVEVINVLTGFKFIGEQIGMMENSEREDCFIFGMEESYGYLSGTYVRDKDAVNGALLICEMTAYHKQQGIGLGKKLEELYEKYGYSLNTLHSYEFDGSVGFGKMQNIMKKFRAGILTFEDKEVKQCIDYSKGLMGLPKSNVLKFSLEENSSLVIRPSGTEPKLKVYISICAENKEKAKEEERKILEYVEYIIG